MNHQIEYTASLINEAYSFQSVSGKNTNFLQSIRSQTFRFCSCTLSSSESLCLHAGGEITYTVPVRFLQSALPYTLLLFITDGKADVRIGIEDLALSTDDVLLIPAGECWRFSTAHTPFSYSVFYLSGCIIDDYLSRICTGSFYYKSDFCNTNVHIRHLLPAIHKQLCKDTADASLHLGALFHLVFSELLDNVQKETATVFIPSYVTDMKQIFDTDYAASHPLDALEQQLGISKYRLCRDFSKYIGISPVQYLNQLRLTEARHLLRTTELTIREVGISVGIENTTHFINLFKKSAGITPLQFRQNLKH